MTVSPVCREARRHTLFARGCIAKQQKAELKYVKMRNRLRKSLLYAPRTSKQLVKRRVLAFISYS